MGRLFAGTSGFAYPSWKPEFYPADCPQKNFLSYYATRLNSVEINYTFRALPAATTLENWVKATSPEFLFVLKGHQRITHFMRLKGVEQFLEIFLRAITPLHATKRLGPILFQLPPQFHCDVDRLAAFLSQLPREMRFALEFRHDSWLSDPVYRLLEKHKAALCLAESEKFEVPEVITADFVYFRLRKADYTPRERRGIAAKVSSLLDDGRGVFVFFKHEETPAGALYAEELLREFASQPAKK